jgi:L-ascorbate metabolism protein UlaG (beta-lactamase superfamily)
MIKKLLFITILIPFFVFATSFKNTNGTAIDKPLKDLLKWSFSSKNPIIEKIKVHKIYKNDLDFFSDSIIWIGHSTFLLSYEGKTVLTDPIFSDRASPLKRFGPKRIIETPIKIEDLPPVDIVTISHNHYDHLDIESLKFLAKKNSKTIFLVPFGDKKLLQKNGIQNVEEFNWWENIKINSSILTFTPTQHWSARGLFDRNESLWGGWYINLNGLSFFHAGDTGYSNDFKIIKEKLSAPEFAFIPIGAYDPEWFMSESHVNPEDAVKIMQDLGAKKAFAMHWATFTLTDEDSIEPKKRLEKEVSKKNIKDFLILEPGKVYKL